MRLVTFLVFLLIVSLMLTACAKKEESIKVIRPENFEEQKMLLKTRKISFDIL